MAPAIRHVREVLRHSLQASRRRTYRRHGFRRIGQRGIALSHAALGEDAYQGLYGFETQPNASERNTLDRWRLIEPHLEGMGSALDIGCQNGWFVFKLAERGLVSIGVEVQERSTRIAQWLTIANASDLAAFLRIDVTPTTVVRLPKTDVVLCLSVFQHWVSFHDLEYATEVMRGLASRCDDRLFFESGTPAESKLSWTKLGFMGSEPLKWTESFLRSLGFSRVEVLGVTPGWKSVGERHLVMASR